MKMEIAIFAALWSLLPELAEKERRFPNKWHRGTIHLPELIAVVPHTQRQAASKKKGASEMLRAFWAVGCVADHKVRAFEVRGGDFWMSVSLRFWCVCIGEGQLW